MGPHFVGTIYSTAAVNGLKGIDYLWVLFFIWLRKRAAATLSGNYPFLAAEVAYGQILLRPEGHSTYNFQGGITEAVIFGAARR